MKGIAVLVAVCLICVQGLTINLKSGKEQCIWEEGKIGDQLYASYEVPKGDSKGLIVTVCVFLSVVFVDQGQFGKAALFIQLQGGGRLQLHVRQAASLDDVLFHLQVGRSRHFLPLSDRQRDEAHQQSAAHGVRDIQ